MEASPSNTPAATLVHHEYEHEGRKASCPRILQHEISMITRPYTDQSPQPNVSLSHARPLSLVNTECKPSVQYKLMTPVADAEPGPAPVCSCIIAPQNSHILLDLRKHLVAGQLTPHTTSTEKGHELPWPQVLLKEEAYLQIHSRPVAVEGQLINTHETACKSIEQADNRRLLKLQLTTSKIHLASMNRSLSGAEEGNRSSPSYMPSTPFADAGMQKISAGSCSARDFQSSSRIRPAEMRTTSTELCMMGWQRFCGAASSLAVKTPAKVSAVHRPIVMISSPHHQNNSLQTSPSQHEVCLELNIGPSKGVSTSGSMKTLQAIHSEERSGFSKWQRPSEHTEKQVLHPRSVQCPCNVSGRSLCSDQKLDLAMEAYGRPPSPLRFYLGSNNDSTVSAYTSTASDCKGPAVSMSCRSKSTDMHVEATCLAPNTSTSGTLMKELPACPYTSSFKAAGSRAHNSKLLPTSMLLQAAFPSEIPSKSCKLNNSHHPRRPPVRSETHQENLELSSITCGNHKCTYTDNLKQSEIVKGKKEPEKRSSEDLLGMVDVDRINLSMPCYMIKSVDMPNIQEKSLVEFLHTKKQHKEHFLDKVVVKEDVYQSHPWHFKSDESGMGAGAGAGGGGSLYFCCSTKYTKRGNMTRNRMTREGGRWKQQGMVQPIFYGRGEVEVAHKTYLSYIPRGSAATTSSAAAVASCSRASFFVNYLNRPVAVDSCTTPAAHSYSGRLKHRHRMIEIALQEDLLIEKRSFQLKVTPKPFLVVCILRNSA